MRQAIPRRVSVIIPCYNQGHFLAEAIESVRGQCYPHVEMLVVDDGSCDNTAEVAARYDSEVRCIRKTNAGLSAARNTGILEASGEFVLFLDADDYLGPGMLEKHMAIAAEAPTAGVFHGGYQYVDMAGRVLDQIEAQTLRPDPFHAMLSANPLVCHCVTVRRSVFARVGLFDVGLHANEDWDMWLRLAATGHQFIPVPGATVAYRQHPGTMTTDFERMWVSGLQVVRRSAQYHRRCALCRAGRARLAEDFFAWCCSVLRDELAARARRGELASGVASVLRQVLQTPVLAPLLARALVRELRPLAGRVRRWLAVWTHP